MALLSTPTNVGHAGKKDTADSMIPAAYEALYPHCQRNQHYSVSTVMQCLKWRLSGQSKEPAHCKPVLCWNGKSLSCHNLTSDLHQFSKFADLFHMYYMASGAELQQVCP